MLIWRHLRRADSSRRSSLRSFSLGIKEFPPLGCRAAWVCKRHMELGGGGVHDRIDARPKLARAGRNPRSSCMRYRQHRGRRCGGVALVGGDTAQPAGARRDPLPGYRGARSALRRTARRGGLNLAVFAASPDLESCLPGRIQRWTTKTSPVLSTATAPATSHAGTGRLGLVVEGVIVSGQKSVASKPIPLRLLAPDLANSRVDVLRPSARPPQQFEQIGHRPAFLVASAGSGRRGRLNEPSTPARTAELEPESTPMIERVRNTNVGRRDKWRTP
jgi:hypothetical protein